MEIWKDIKGYEGMYQVSNLGKVRSLDRTVTQKHTKGFMYDRVMKGRVLRPIENNKGYLSVTLSSPNKKYERPLIHRLVASHFLDNEDNKPQVNHIDTDKHNNAVSNLEWVTGRENYDHAMKMGIYKNRKKPSRKV